jgi:hypothetical protein
MHSLQAFRFIKMNDSVKMASEGGLEFHLTKTYEPVLHTYARQPRSEFFEIDHPFPK